MDGRLWVLVLVLALVTKNECARILAVFPTPSISHQVVFRSLTQELARRGHEVTVWTPDPAFPAGKAPPNLTEIDLHEDSYKLWRETFVASVDGETEPLKTLQVGFDMMQKVFEMQFYTEAVQTVLKTKKFDLLLTEACVRAALMVQLIVKDVPIIQVSSFSGFMPNFQVHGTPIHPVIYPEATSNFINSVTLSEKLGVLRYYYLNKNIFMDEVLINDMIKKAFGSNAPTINEIENNVDMLLINVNPIWDGNRPVPPSIIYMGGLHMKPVKELPSDLKAYLDSSKNGVIYMSFGTNVDPALLPPEKFQVFLNVFSKLPYDVMLKWNKDELEGKPKNVKTFNWVPQFDLLNHPKIKLFITQAGLQSSDEAVAAGVPLIAFPMLADQWFNAGKYVQHKIGLQLDIETVTEETLHQAINQVINDSSYRENSKKLGIIMRDQPQTPLERAVWWTEYVIRHKGAKHLRSPGANMHWTEYYMLDVVSLLVGGVVLSISVIVIISLLLIKKVKNILGLEKKQKKS